MSTQTTCHIDETHSNQSTPFITSNQYDIKDSSSLHTRHVHSYPMVLSAPPIINVHTTTTALDEVADSICPIKYRKNTSASGIITLFINIGSNSELKRAEIYELTNKHKADVVFVTDCKVTTTNMASTI